MTVRADAHGPEFLRKMPPVLPVRLATTVNIVLSGLVSVDGTGTVAGDRVLVKNQTTASQNGLYVVRSGAWERSFDMSEGLAAWGAVVYVITGPTNGGKRFRNTNASLPAVGTTSLTFSEEAGGGAGGGDAGSYHHTQSTPSTTWTVDHMLGRHPVVSVLDSAGSQVEVSVAHTTLNQLVLTLSYAVSGTADCS